MCLRTVEQRPPDKRKILDVSAISMFSTTTAKSDESFQNSQDELCIMQKLLSYEVPETLKCIFGEETYTIQEFMNAISYSLSRNVQIAKSRKFTDNLRNLNDMNNCKL